MTVEDSVEAEAVDGRLDARGELLVVEWVAVKDSLFGDLRRVHRQELGSTTRRGTLTKGLRNCYACS